MFLVARITTFRFRAACAVLLTAVCTGPADGQSPDVSTSLNRLTRTLSARFRSEAAEREYNARLQELDAVLADPNSASSRLRHLQTELRNAIREILQLNKGKIDIETNQEINEVLAENIRDTNPRQGE